VPFRYCDRGYDRYRPWIRGAAAPRPAQALQCRARRHQDANNPHLRGRWAQRTALTISSAPA